MKPIRLLANVLLFIAVLMFLSMVLDFLALTDIFHDYVSKTAIARFTATKPDVFPEWTNTPGEWRIVNLGYVLKLAGIMATIILLVVLRKKTLKPLG